VVEQGSHEELIQLPHGRYKRLFDSSKRESTVRSVDVQLDKITRQDKKDEEDEEEIDWEAKIEEEESKAFDGKRARSMAAPDKCYLLFGSIGAIMAGAVFPLWGVLFSETIDLLFQRVLPCEEGNIPEPGFTSCEQYWQDTAEEMREGSYQVSLYWAIVLVGCVVGNVIVFWGFGVASERLNKRVRDSSFQALLRQEVAYFDKRSVGSITSQLQDDAARIHAFSGEPVRSFLIAVSSIGKLSFFTNASAHLVSLFLTLYFC